LEDFCRNNKLGFLLASSEDFKDTNPSFSESMRNEESEDRRKDTHYLTINTGGFDQASNGSFGQRSVKDFHDLLDQVLIR